MAVGGNLASFGIGVQTVKGTAVAATYFPRWLAGSMLDPTPNRNSEVEGDGTRTKRLDYTNKLFYKGKLVCYPRPIEASLLLSWTCGKAADAITGSSPYVHTLTPQSTTGYATVTKTVGPSGTQVVDQVVDCVVDKLSIIGEPGKPIRFEVDYLGISGTDNIAAPTVTLESGSPFMYFTGPVLKIGGSSDANISHFQIDIMNHIDQDIYAESATPLDLPFTLLEVMGDFERIFDGPTYYDEIYNNNAHTTSGTIFNTSLDFTWTQSASAIIETICTSIDLLEGPVVPDVSGKALRQKVKWRTPDASTLSAKVTNTKSTAITF